MYTTNSDAMVKYVNASTGQRRILPERPCNRPWMMEAAMTISSRPPKDLHRRVARFQSTSGHEVSLEMRGPVYFSVYPAGTMTGK